LDGDEERRALEIDELPLVLEEGRAGCTAFGRGRRRSQRLGAVPPELRDTVVRLRTSARRLQRGVHGVVERVCLHVATNAERGRVRTDERRMALEPVLLERLAREMREPP